METIVIRKRTYTVTTQETKTGKMWILTGKRGAVYGTMRNVNSGLLFIIGGSGLGRCGEVWLTDKDGTLKVHREY